MPEVIETSYRVYRFSPSLIASWRKVRDKQGSTNLAFITEATGRHLPSVVRELRAVGLTALAEDPQAVRMEVPITVLRELGAAREATGVSATALLGICLRRASSKRMRKG